MDRPPHGSFPPPSSRRMLCNRALTGDQPQGEYACGPRVRHFLSAPSSVSVQTGLARKPWLAVGPISYIIRMDPAIPRHEESPAVKTISLSPLFHRYLLAGIQFALGDLPGDTTPSEK